MSVESGVLVTRVDYEHVLDGGVVGASRELAIYEDAGGEVHLALEGVIIELMREGCRRHCCGMDGGV